MVRWLLSLLPPLRSAWKCDACGQPNERERRECWSCGRPPGEHVPEAPPRGRGKWEYCPICGAWIGSIPGPCWACGQDMN